MEKESERVGQKVKLFLITGHQYSGVVISEDNFFLQIRDKFNAKVSIQKSQIQVLQELI